VIFLSDDAATVRKRVHSMYTIRTASRRHPGTVEATRSSPTRPVRSRQVGVEELKTSYRAGAVAMSRSRALTDVLNTSLTIRERFCLLCLTKRPGGEIIYEGTLRYREIAGKRCARSRSMVLRHLIASRQAEERKKNWQMTG